MDFFNAQRYHKRRSLQLYGLFFLIIGLHALVLYAVFAFIFILFKSSFTYWLFLFAIVITLGGFIIGSWVEYHRLKAGGRAIAKRIGAVRLFIDHSVDQMVVSRGLHTDHSHQSNPANLLPKVLYRPHQIVVRDAKDFPSEYRRYHEFAAQMAIASGIQPPILYVLPDEKGINGFVAGRDADDTVMVLTQGALESLTDEGLYGLIAHEYGHILHGDARFNLHLMVVLAGLQLLYDWTDPVDNSLTQSGDYARRVTQQQQALKKQLSAQLTLPSEQIPAQTMVDRQARQIEQQTANFDDYGQWVAYWRQQSQSPTALAQQINSISGGRSLSARPAYNNDLVTLLLHLLSFSSMLSAQLIKHSFNRQRELLADATSVQLTRSPAIMETLRSIHQHPLGSRLSVTPETHGLSHFFFASSSMDLGDSSWFSTHPSLSARMQAIDRGDYEVFARKVAEARRINQQAIKEIYQQRRLGDWGDSKSPNLQEGAPLEFTPIADVVVDGRLQTEGFRAELREIRRHTSHSATHEPQTTESASLLYPQRSKRDVELPDGSISLAHLNRVSFPQIISEHFHHPLGAVGLIEAILLCHHHKSIDVRCAVSVRQLWLGDDDPSTSDINEAHSPASIAPVSSVAVDTGKDNLVSRADDSASSKHLINEDLLEAVAGLDRRMDSALIELACRKLGKHNISKDAIHQACQVSQSEHTHEASRRHQQLSKYHQTLSRYLSMLTLLTAKAERPKAVYGEAQLKEQAQSKEQAQEQSQEQVSMSPLWRAGHLYLLIEAIQQALSLQTPALTAEALIDHHRRRQQQFFTNKGAEKFANEKASKRINKEETQQLAYKAINCSADDILGLKPWQLSKLQLLVLILINQQANHYRPSMDDQQEVERLQSSLYRLARLIDIPLSSSNSVLMGNKLRQEGAVVDHSEANAQASSILTALLSTASSWDSMDVLGMILDARQGAKDKRQLSLWLNTFYTAMLSDGILAQDEFDTLTLLAYIWLGERQFVAN